ncbi:hypothetical protein GCM10009801_45800 [Streptomyces albiaxialis]|uniref:Uncharacterized protein n=1 Tax=Streptomyces albiaxialis TaxID=329523 RepID=A0ABP5HTB4_9ACTN
MEVTGFRRLPWNGAEGQPEYIRDDNPDGPMARLADTVEKDQLQAGEAVLQHTRELMTEKSGELSPEESNYVVNRLAECLNDALLVAKSRGQRTPGQQRPKNRHSSKLYGPERSGPQG